MFMFFFGSHRDCTILHDACGVAGLENSGLKTGERSGQCKPRLVVPGRGESTDARRDFSLIPLVHGVLAPPDPYRNLAFCL